MLVVVPSVFIDGVPTAFQFHETNVPVELTLALFPKVNPLLLNEVRPFVSTDTALVKFG